jgi:hypothetical protein
MLELQTLIPIPREFKHITDIFSQGVSDSDWVPQIAKSVRKQ